MGGPDSGFSMQPNEFQNMVNTIREVEKAIGQVYYPTEKENISGRYCSRSLFICENIKKGEILNSTNLRSIRPGYGLHPKFLNELLGKKVNQDLEKGTPMDFKYLS